MSVDEGQTSKAVKNLNLATFKRKIIFFTTGVAAGAFENDVEALVR